MFLTRNVSKGVVRFSELLHLPSKKYTPRFKKNIRFSIGAEAVWLYQACAISNNIDQIQFEGTSQLEMSVYFE